MSLLRISKDLYDVYEKVGNFRGILERRQNKMWYALNYQGTLVAESLDTKEAAASFLLVE